MKLRQLLGEDAILVVPADALDIDLRQLIERHRETAGVATLAVKRVDDVSDRNVVIAGADGRVQGLQHQPHPDEALSDLVDLGTYCLSAEAFEYIPDSDLLDWARDVFPALLEHDVPVYV